MSMNFPKREELSFLMVFALPKASKIGLERRTCSSMLIFLWSLPVPELLTLRGKHLRCFAGWRSTWMACREHRGGKPLKRRRLKSSKILKATSRSWTSEAVTSPRVPPC